MSPSTRLPPTTRVRNPLFPQTFPTLLFRTWPEAPQKDPHSTHWQRTAGVPTQGVGPHFSAVLHEHLVENLVIDVHTICHLKTGPREPVTAPTRLPAFGMYEHTHPPLSLPEPHQLRFLCAHVEVVCVCTCTHTTQTHAVLRAAAGRGSTSGALLRPRAVGWGQSFRKWVRERVGLAWRASPR